MDAPELATVAPAAVAVERNRIGNHGGGVFAGPVDGAALQIRRLDLFIRRMGIGLYSSETAELNRRDYGGHLCLLTHCSIPSGVTGKQRPAVPLGCDMSKEQRSSSPPGGGYAACLLQFGCRRAAITHPPSGIPMRE